MADKEKNYISAVVYLGEERMAARPFLEMLTGRLSQRFSQYELVFVNDSSRDGTAAAVAEFVAEMEAAPPVTMVNLSLKQGLELAMNAGLDIAVGDYLYEFDSMQMPYPPEMVDEAYDACVAGSDIVNVSPRGNRGAASSMFYRLFNRTSGSAYPLRTDAFRLVSRRAFNRVQAMATSVPYRKASYAASGMRMETLVYEGQAAATGEQLRFSRAVNSLILYTDVASRASFVIAAAMLLLMVASLVYVLVVVLGGQNPVAGWTTLMLLLTGGFFGVFLILAIVLKHLALVIEMLFRRQQYLVESIEKLI